MWSGQSSKLSGTGLRRWSANILSVRSRSCAAVVNICEGQSHPSDITLSAYLRRKWRGTSLRGRWLNVVRPSAGRKLLESKVVHSSRCNCLPWPAPRMAYHCDPAWMSKSVSCSKWFGVCGGSFWRAPKGLPLGLACVALATDGYRPCHPSWHFDL